MSASRDPGVAVYTIRRRALPSTVRASQSSVIPQTGVRTSTTRAARLSRWVEPRKMID
jgi:hypothetical protein